MKKLILLLPAIILCISSYSQISAIPEIDVNLKYPFEDNPDTTRTFSINKTGKEKCIEAMIATWGKPSENTHYSI